MLLIQGHLDHLDLVPYLGALRWLGSGSAMPAIRAQLLVADLTVAGVACADASLQAQRSEDVIELQLKSAALSGTARLLLGGHVTPSADIHLTRLDLPESPGVDSDSLIAALAPGTRLTVDDLRWHGHSLGNLSASFAVQDDVLSVSDIRLVADTHEAQADIRCQVSSAACRLSFDLDSHDAADTLQAFGFRPDLTASQASLKGVLEWRANERPWGATVEGSVSMRLADGVTRVADSTAGRRFALFTVPALIAAPGPPTADALQAGQASGELRFARLEADFELQGGQATTGNFHFDGDAEILMRGRTGLLAHDYDQQIWVLHGEERLPAAVRRLGANPRVAAVWLSMRELFAGGTPEERSKTVFRLQGTWDDPIVTVAGSPGPTFEDRSPPRP
jgi:uncharacterized protein YhdP